MYNYRVLIATPAYGNQVTIGYMNSILATKDYLTSKKIDVVVETIGGDSLIPRVRNAHVSRFLSGAVDNQPFTHLMFVDADVDFPAEAIAQLIHTDKFCIGAYPLKSNNVGYPLEFEIPLIERDGLISILSGGTGFMCIPRIILEEIVKGCSIYRNDIPEYNMESNNYKFYKPLTFYNIFETNIINYRYLSEDYEICRKWRALGGNIWLDPSIKLGHSGTARYCHKMSVKEWMSSFVK